MEYSLLSIFYGIQVTSRHQGLLSREGPGNENIELCKIQMFGVNIGSLLNVLQPFQYGRIYKEMVIRLSDTTVLVPTTMHFFVNSTIFLN